MLIVRSKVIPEMSFAGAEPLGVLAYSNKALKGCVKRKQYLPMHIQITIFHFEKKSNTALLNMRHARS